MNDRIEGFYTRLGDVIDDAKGNFRKEFKKMKIGKILKAKDDQVYNTKLKIGKYLSSYAYFIGIHPICFFQ